MDTVLRPRRARSASPPAPSASPGQRVFFLQARAAGEVVPLKCEKQQVAALAEYLAGILADLPVRPTRARRRRARAGRAAAAEWVVGRIGVACDERPPTAWCSCARSSSRGGRREEPADDARPASARFGLTRAQVAAFVAAAPRAGRGRPAAVRPLRPADGPRRPRCPRINSDERS